MKFQEIVSVWNDNTARMRKTTRTELRGDDIDAAAQELP